MNTVRLPTEGEVLARQYDLVYDIMQILLRTPERPLGLVYHYLVEYAIYLEDWLDYYEITNH